MADKTPAKRAKRGKKESFDFGGLDPNIMMAIMKKIKPNPITGKVDILDIMKYMEQNPSEITELMAEVGRLKIGNPTVDLSKYDYKALGSAIIHESFWVIQLENMGFVDKMGNAIDPSQAHSSTGLRPTFIIYCYDENGAFRITRECVGLPDSNTILQTIQQAIAEPTLPLKPCLPWFLLLSIKLSQHAPALRPFLDALPAPFHWRVETRQEAEGVHEGVHSLNQDGVRNAMTLAERSKTAGNKAFSQKDRKTALKAYGEALGYLLDVFCQKPNPADEEKAKKLQAICYANRAATYLIPGEGVDLAKALKDGKDAETADPSYAKVYIRQAAASQQLGNKDDALDAIARALRRKDLENDVALVDRFIDLMTYGEGFSNDEETFKNWMLDVLINDAKSSARLRGIQGEWKRRCDAHFRKWQRRKEDDCR